MPPPPPPPPPMPGRGGPPPPPPPPPPGGAPGAAGLSARPPAGGGGRSALLSDISKGRALKKAVTNDRSAPIVGTSSGGPGPSPMGAPPIPGGMPKAPGGLAPPVPGVGGNRARSNSDQGSRDAAVSSMESAPQLAGLFAGGMPKLKKTGGGVATGANRDASYLSDPESSSSRTAPKPPSMSAPKPPGGAAPPIPGRPPPLTSPSTPTFHPSIANLRKTARPDVPRPFSSASLLIGKGPPPPLGKKPPPPPGSRKPSSTVPSFLPPPIPGAPAPPPPPGSAPSLPPAPPPAPPITAPRPPPAPARSQPPLPPPPPPSNGTNVISQSIAMQAAIRASAGAQSPTSAPPPPPPPSAPPRASAPSPPGPTPLARSQVASASRASLLDPANFTLGHNGGSKASPSPTRQLSGLGPRPGSAGGRGERYIVNDARWRFITEDKFPKPRDFHVGQKRYRASRGSSVPLDLSAM